MRWWISGLSALLLAGSAAAQPVECDVDISSVSSWAVTMTGLRKLTADPGNDYVLACRGCNDILVSATITAVDARQPRPTDGVLALGNEQSHYRMLRDESLRAAFIEKYRSSTVAIFRECSLSADFGDQLIVDGVALTEVHSMWHCPGGRAEWRRQTEMLGYRNGCGYSLKIGWLDKNPLSVGDRTRVRSLLDEVHLKP